jgi:hypothetical protein
MGYVLGFQDPGADDFQPFNPDLLDVYQQAFDTGKDDNFSSASNWVSKEDIPEGIQELAEHVAIETFFELASHLFKQATLGLVGVVINVLGVPGDTQLRPLDDDFDEEYTGPETDTNITYTALCPRPDHLGSGLPGVTSDGYWTGAPHNDFGDALNDARLHAHSETVIARCSLSDNTCGVVWIARN